MEIPQVMPYVGEEEKENLIDVIDSKWLSEGNYSEEFKQQISDFTGVEYVVLANNGTMSLFFGLKALGIEEGDEVIVPDFTFNTSASSVSFAGGTPVFADVDEQTFQIDVDDVESKITDDTWGIMPVHIYGQACDMEAICRLADEHDLAVLEDAAQGVGVYWRDQHVGTIGDVGILSLYADKTLTTGEGGVILTDDEQTYEKLVRLKNMGRAATGSFVHPHIGLNSHFTDLQAAVGVAQFEKIDEIIEAKQRNLDLYRELLETVDEVSFMEQRQDTNIVPFRAPALVKDLNGLIGQLNEAGVHTRRFFYPLHRQPCFDFLGYPDDACPSANAIYSDGLCLPVFPGLKSDEIEYVCTTIREYYQ